jgi:gamma-glutamyl hercynylcysteine S-oxide synthase
MVDDPAMLERDLLASRARATRVTADLDGERLLGPKLAIVNPPLWEIGHVGWFQERWCLRQQPAGALADSILPGADALYDSAAVAHDTRWDLPLPDLAATRAYLANVLERVRERLAREPDNASLQYFVRLATFHEDMHAEAFHYTRQTLGYPDPFRAVAPAAVPTPRGDIEHPGGRFRLGAEPNGGFAFDNEKWAHEVEIAPFRMSRAPVTNAEFLAYVEEGGQAPRYWKKADGAWLQRRFDRWLPLVPDEPVLHVDWNEAQAYCRWAKRRLPTEAEWEYAASATKQRYPWGDHGAEPARANLDAPGVVPVGAFAAGDSPAGARQLIGNVWEWTASTFTPYPGFVVDPYKEYSEPWFGTHKVLRGGSFATPARLIRNTWRNFYTPDRGDVFAGFRTCAID